MPQDPTPLPSRLDKMAGDLPFLKFDPDGLTALGKDSFDAQDFAALWGPITKCKHRLSDGHRLENLIWRAWNHETNLSRLSRPRVDGAPDGLVTDPTGGLLRPATPATGVGAELSDPEAGGSVTSASEDDDEHFLRSSSARIWSFCSDRASSNDTSIPSEDELSRRSQKARMPNGAPAFLPLVPSADSLDPTARQHRAPSSHSLPPFDNLASPSTTPRPNAVTPSGLAKLIQTMMPMDLAAEHARVRCLALSAEVAKLGVHIPGGGSSSSSRSGGDGVESGAVAMSKGEKEGAEGGSAAATPSVRWTAPEPGLLSQLVSAEATPVGTPTRRQRGSSSSLAGPTGTEAEQLMPPRIVNIAPTPPTKSPADSPEAARSKDKDADLPPPPSTPPPRFEPSTATKTTSSEDPSAIEPPVGPSSSSVTTAVTTSTRSSGGSGETAGNNNSSAGPLRPAFAKRRSTNKTVRISPPLKPVSGAAGPSAAAMERRGSSGSQKGASSSKSGGRSSSLGVSLTPSGSSSKSKGKARAATEGGRSSRSAKKQSGVSGSAGVVLGSPLGLRDSSSSLCTMVDALPEYKAPQRTVRGFDTLSNSVNTTAAQQAAAAAAEAAAEATNNGPSPTGVPATPANSHASRSEASSASYPVGFPEAPPPTPASHGAPLPTTMTSRSVALDGQSSAQQQPHQHQAQQQQARAKFFLDNHHDTDDEASLSPRSSKSAGSFRRLSQRSEQVGSPLVPPPPPPSLANSHSLPGKRALAPAPQPTPAVVEEVVEEEDDDDDAYETETDSDEWGSEYTDSEAEEEAREAERRDKQAAFQRELFQKHEIPRNSLAEDGAGPVKRAGLSMMFDQKLRNPAAQGNAPMRNLSSVELRPPPANPAKSAKPPSLSPQHQQRMAAAAVAAAAGRQVVGERRSFSSFKGPGLSSLIKSKSSVAVPALTQVEPSVDVVKSPSVIDLTSFRPATTSSRGGSGKNNSSGSSNQRPNPTRTGTGAGNELRPPAMGRQPSKLGAKPPSNIEFSDSDSDDEDGESMQRRPSDEQHARLAAFAARVDKQAAAVAAAAEAEDAEAQARVRPVAGHNGVPAGVDLGGYGGPGAMPYAAVEPTAAIPLSPRTTRRNMIAREMSESVRRNLLWERQMGAEALGLRPGKPPPVKVEVAMGDDYGGTGFHETGW